MGCQCNIDRLVTISTLRHKHGPDKIQSLVHAVIGAVCIYEIANLVLHESSTSNFQVWKKRLLLDSFSELR